MYHFLATQLAYKILPLASLLCAIDALSLIATSILSSTGFASFCTVITAIGFYVIGIPLACALVFYYKLGIVGLLIGTISGCIFKATVLTTSILTKPDYFLGLLPSE